MPSEVITEAVIAAPIALVWEVLTDTAAFPAWNPVIRGLRPRGPLVAGARARLTIALVDGLPPLRIAVRLRCVDFQRQIGWVGGIPGVVRGHHYFKVRAIDDAHTQLTHGEAFIGALAGPVWPLFAATLKARYQATNAAIIERCAALQA